MIPAPDPLPGQLPVVPAAGALAGRPPVAPVPGYPPSPPPAVAPRQPRPVAPPPPTPPPAPATVAPQWGPRTLSSVAPAHAAPHAPVEPMAPMPTAASAPSVAPPPPAPPVIAPPPAPPAPTPSMMSPPAAPPPPRPASPPPAPVVANPRTVSNWRERRSAPLPMAPPPSRAHEVEAAAYAAADAGEDLRAKHTRLVALAGILATVVIGVMVLWSTGLLGSFGPKRATPTNVVDGANAGATPAPAAGVSPGAAATPMPAKPVAVPAGRPAFGLQVASFRTAGRAARVLHDYVETTGLPGEVLTSEMDGVTWYRIVLGRFPGEPAARTAADDLLNRSLIAESIVIPYTPQKP